MNEINLIFNINKLFKLLNMYLPSLNELNRSALPQKVVDQDDERVRRNKDPEV